MTVRELRLLVLLWAALTVFSGCSGDKQTSKTGESMYAAVNGNSLTESDFRSLVPTEFYDRLTQTHKKEIVDEWIQSELLYQEAVRLGLDKEPRISRILEKSRRDLLSAEILSRKLSDIPIPSDGELKRYYDENSDYFILQSDEYAVRYALFDTIENARDFFNKVKKGASFSDLAIQDSKDPSARNGGDLGVINEESVEPAVWSEIINTTEKLGLRKISSPFSVIEGFGIVIVDELYKMGTLKPFNLVRDQVLDFYMMEKRQASKENLIRQLTSDAKIEYYF